MSENLTVIPSPRKNNFTIAKMFSDNIFAPLCSVLLFVTVCAHKLIMLTVRDQNKPTTIPNGTHGDKSNDIPLIADDPSKENLCVKLNDKKKDLPNSSRSSENKNKRLLEESSYNIDEVGLIKQGRRRPFRIRLVTFAKGTSMHNRPRHFRRPVITRLSQEQQQELFKERPDLSPERNSPFVLAINDIMRSIFKRNFYTSLQPPKHNAKEHLEVRELLNSVEFVGNARETYQLRCMQTIKKPKISNFKR